MSLQNARLQKISADRTISPPNLETMLGENGKRPILLYPPTPEANSLGLETPLPMPNLSELQEHPCRLVVIDATWRKSRKILYLNRALQQLPRLTLEHTPDSLYLIRKAAGENELSTLEASCYALQYLEQTLMQETVDYSPLLLAMRAFVAQQAAFRPD